MMMYSINTFWSADNTIAAQRLQESIHTEIKHTWTSKRYRRLVYYFFEKEIQSDIRQRLESDMMKTHHFLVDPEYQACIARSALGRSLSGGIIWDDVTFLINNYLFRQDIFAIADDESDGVLHEQVLRLLGQGDSPEILHGDVTWMSDMLLQCRRMRAGTDLVQSICDGHHTYASLLKTCGEYIGQYACLPHFFDYLHISRSTDDLLSLLEQSTHDKLMLLLQPSYEIVCRLLSPDEVKAYGQVSIIDTPYSTWIGRLGYRRSHTAWYIKIALSMAIVLVSGLWGGMTLIVLPIVWGIIAIARSISQHLNLLTQLLTNRYTHYTTYNANYIVLYDTMIDPDQSTKNSISAQKTMTRRYDVVPFSGHELMWDAKQYAKTLFDALISSLSSGFSASIKDIAMISAVYDRGLQHNLSLMVVQDGNYTEQVSYRFESLLVLVQSLTGSLITESQYVETYDIVDELVSTKKHNFWFRTYRDAMIDGMMVACSSGVLGWMGSYLRNRSITGSAAFAAGPGMVTHTITQSDSVVFDPHLLSAMTSVMKPEDMTRFVDTLAHHGQSETLWNTMVDLFGRQQGNIYINRLMDQRWRVGEAGHSNLFDSALAHGLPTSSTDAGWTKMLHVLHRIYGYDNLQDYEILINKPWLSETLRGLKDGTISLDQFAQLDLKQREIITQAMFSSVPKTDLSGLFVEVQAGQVVDVSGSLSLGQKILNILGWKNEQVIPVVETGGKMGGNLIETGTNDLNTGTALSGDSGRWREQFTGNQYIGSGDIVVIQSGYNGDRIVEMGSTVVESSDTVVASGVWGGISARWHTLVHPTYTITETGTQLADTGTKLEIQVLETGKIDHILSGISPDDIQSQATGFAEQLAHPTSSSHLSAFTWPVLRRDKRVE